MWKVKLRITRMGCRFCKQEFEASVGANSAEDAVAKVKAMSKTDLDTHKFHVVLVKAV